MRENNNKIKKRLGRLAWKSVDTMIELNEKSGWKMILNMPMQYIDYRVINVILIM